MPATKAMYCPSGDQSDGNQIGSARARCANSILCQQRLIGAAAACTLLIELCQTLPIGPKSNPPAIRRPDRRRVQRRAKREWRCIATHQVDQPDIGKGHLRIDQRRRQTRVVGREPEVRVVVIAVRANLTQWRSAAVEPGQASWPQAWSPRRPASPCSKRKTRRRPGWNDRLGPQWASAGRQARDASESNDCASRVSSFRNRT